MYDCRKSWGSTKFRFVSHVSITLLIVFSSLAVAQESTEPFSPETPPAESVESAEPATIPPVETGESVEPVAASPAESEEEAAESPATPPAKPQAEESQVGDEALRGALAIMDGADPNSVDQGGLDSEMLSEGASTVQNAILKMIGGLSVVLAMILFVYWGFRKFGKGIPALAGRQLGQVIGQLHLTRDATLYYVRTGGRVLLISLSSGEVRTVAEFDESAFPSDAGATLPHRGFQPERFVEELKEQSAAYRPGGGSGSDVSDDDMASLRSDIHRLQEYLQEETRDSND